MSTEGHHAAVLRGRARALAKVPPSTALVGEMLELLELRMADERYAVETRFVGEVHPLRDLTPLPGTPDFVRGIVNLRGRIVPVYDLRRLFGLTEQGITDLHRIVLIEGPDFELGLLADVVIGVCTLPCAALAPPPTTVSAIAAEYLAGVTEERLVVLNLERILNDPRIVVNDGDSQ
jgi:purine-binding chemotaxis protein CheW